MNDKELDKKLQIACSQSKDFFSKFDFDLSRKMVYKRIKDKEQAKAEGIGRFFNKGAYMVTAAVSCAAALAIFVSNPAEYKGAINPGAPVLQQAIGLDNRDSYLVNYFRIDNPNKENNLLAVLWQKNSKGNYDIIYSSIMENADIPNPVAVISIPSSESMFAVVSSSSKDKGYIHYRLIKYSSNSVTAYLEENYVPKGKIEIDNGMLIEERTVPGDYYAQSSDKSIQQFSKIYRYFIPVELRDDGSFALTTNQVTLKKGAVLTLVSDEMMEPLVLEYDSGVLDKKGSRLNGSETMGSSVDFEAREKGFANIRIGGQNNIDKANELFIEVVD